MACTPTVQNGSGCGAQKCCTNFDCPGFTQCTGRLGPTFGGPTITWSCPTDVSGAKGVLQKITTGGDPDILSCVENAVCSTGNGLVTVINGPMSHPNQAGDCSGNTPNGTVVSDCSTNGGIQGFTGRVGSRIDDITFICRDGTQKHSNTGGGSGGTIVPPLNCPSTHFASKISAEGAGDGGDRAVAVTLTCDPLTNFCKGNNLLTQQCFDFCRQNLGQCDVALIDFCSDSANFDQPICGCALPDSEYAINQLKNQGISIPIACDKRCQGTGVIPLANTGQCNIGTVCIQSDIDITAVQSEIGNGITLQQNCTSGGTASGGIAGINIDPTVLFFIISFFLIFLIVVLVVAILLSGSSRRSSERRLQALI